MTTIAQPPAPGTLDAPRLALRPREAAQALGVSERTLWSLTADRTSGIPHIKIGRATLYPVRELTEWLASRANADPPNAADA